MKKYTSIIVTKEDCIDNEGNVRSRTYKYEASRLRAIYEAALSDTLNYGGIYYGFVYDKQGRAVKQIVSIGREIAVYAKLDYQARLDAAELYEAHMVDDVIAL